ncbi:hypothetical protein D3C81_1282780 [compost metagenome]
MGQFQHRTPELFESIAGFVIQADLDEHQQTTLQVLRIEPGVVAHDDPFALQAPDPLGAGRGREPDLFPKLGERDAPVRLQDPQDAAVDLVQLTFGLSVGTHRGCASVKRVFAENCRQI